MHSQGWFNFLCLKPKELSLKKRSMHTIFCLTQWSTVQTIEGWWYVLISWRRLKWIQRGRCVGCRQKIPSLSKYLEFNIKTRVMKFMMLKETVLIVKATAATITIVEISIALTKIILDSFKTPKRDFLWANSLKKGSWFKTQSKHWYAVLMISALHLRSRNSASSTSISSWFKLKRRIFQMTNAPTAIWAPKMRNN